MRTITHTILLVALVIVLIVLVIVGHVEAQSSDVGTLPVAYTNTANVWSESQFFLGDYNQVYGQSFNFHRPDVKTASWIRWFRDDDPNLGDGGTAPHYVALGMDFAVGGYYWAIYDNLIGQDLFLVGVDPPYCGRFKVGIDGINPASQFAIHDVDAGITNTMEILSYNNGIIINSRNPFADAFTVQRDNDYLSHFINFHQGSGHYDWRIGMNPTQTGIPYDLVFLNAQGDTHNSPQYPGVEAFRLAVNPMRAVFSVPIVGDGSGLTNVIPPYIPTNTLFPLGGFGQWVTDNGYHGWVGVQVTPGSDDMLLEVLGRYSIAGLTNKQHMILVLNADHTTNGMVTLPRTAKQGIFVWANCNIMVSAGTTNYIVTDVGDGDYFGAQTVPTISDTNVAGIYAAYGPSPEIVVADMTLTNKMCAEINYVR